MASIKAAQTVALMLINTARYALVVNCVLDPGGRKSGTVGQDATSQCSELCCARP